MNLFGPSDPSLARSILDGLREPMWTVEVTPRIARDEDVRALALEHEERRAASGTENPPSVSTSRRKSPRTSV